MLNFVVDAHIPFIHGVLEPYGNVAYLTPEEITPQAVALADALLVRTRTHIGPELLADSRCRFVATATIGMDHFDTEWCSRAGVVLHNAPGCNAPAVAQYVMSAIGHLINRPVRQHTLAIVGVGHVGSLVERWARALDMNVMLVDPPRQEAEGTPGWHTLADVAHKADIITFHTPLIKDGPWPTFHLADETFFSSLRRAPIIINSSRGPVVDNKAWLAAIGARRTKAAVVDVWEGEPDISRQLLEAADIATPHIAGYSLDGKIRATQMVLDAVSQHFGLPRLKADAPEASPVPTEVTMAAAIRSYDPLADTAALRANPDNFEALRDHYALRHEIVSSRID